MIGIILVFAFVGSMTYSVYSMYTAANTSNLAGLGLSGVLGTIGAIFIDGVSHISVVVNNCLAFTASYGEWMVVIGMVVFTGSLVYNGITTQGKNFNA